MARLNRKSAPKVKGGRVQKKNNWELSRDDYYEFTQALPVIDRKRPGSGYRHLLRKGNVVEFIALLPQWDELAEGLDAIVLAPGEDGLYGWHEQGVVHICAWPADLWERLDDAFFEPHRDLLDRLGVPYVRRQPETLCKWTDDTARAFQLLHVLLHELGHHHDRITTATRRGPGRGEPYAERYARDHGDLIWDRYIDVFGLD